MSKFNNKNRLEGRAREAKRYALFARVHKHFNRLTRPLTPHIAPRRLFAASYLVLRIPKEVEKKWREEKKWLAIGLGIAKPRSKKH